MKLKNIFIFIFKMMSVNFSPCSPRLTVALECTCSPTSIQFSQRSGVMWHLKHRLWVCECMCVCVPTAHPLTTEADTCDKWQNYVHPRDTCVPVCSVQVTGWWRCGGVDSRQPDVQFPAGNYVAFSVSTSAEPTDDGRWSHGVTLAAVSTALWQVVNYFPKCYWWAQIAVCRVTYLVFASV